MRDSMRRTATKTVVLFFAPSVGILRDHDSRQMIAFHLCLPLGDAWVSAARLTDAQEIGRARRKPPGPRVNLFLKRSPSRSYSFGKRNRYRDLSGFQASLKIGARIFQARRRLEVCAGQDRETLREKDAASLEIRLCGPRSIGIRYLEEIDLRQCALEFGRRFLLWELDDRDIEASSKNAGRCWKCHQETDQDRAHVRNCLRPALKSNRNVVQCILTGGRRTVNISPASSGCRAERLPAR